MKKFLSVVLCIMVMFSVLGCKKLSEEKGRQSTEPLKQTVLKSAGKETKETEKRPEISDKAIDFLGTLNISLSEVAEGVKPSVVNISTKKTVSLKDHPFGEFFNDPFFRRFFGDKFHQFEGRRNFKTPSLGSGVIVTGDGYILTNNHVVQDVEEIKVVLHDKQEFEGKLIGTDPKSDLAIVKVETEGLPAIKMGASDALKVGELVIAIGNPFGLGNTITMGIVSAVGRSNVGIAEYEDFIQTDAAINPGNSGGALVNIRGELVGINTAIFSTSGGYMGIGFAIPSDMANTIMQSIITYGKVVRGWLGVTIQNVTADLAKHFDIEEEKGALVTDILKDTPAEKAGVKRGDVIIEFNGKSVEDSTDLRNQVASTLPDTAVKIKVIREGEFVVLDAIIGEQPSKMAGVRSTYENVLAGVHVQDLTPEIKQKLDIKEKTTGVIITNIEGDSPALEKLKRNDVIQEINKKDIKDTEDFKEVASKIDSKESALILVFRSGGYIYVTISP
jgi:serine protease Do